MHTAYRVRLEHVPPPAFMLLLLLVIIEELRLAVAWCRANLEAVSWLPGCRKLPMLWCSHDGVENDPNHSRVAAGARAATLQAKTNAIGPVFLFLAHPILIPRTTAPRFSDSRWPNSATMKSVAADVGGGYQRGAPSQSCSCPARWFGPLVADCGECEIPVPKSTPSRQANVWTGNWRMLRPRLSAQI